MMNAGDVERVAREDAAIRQIPRGHVARQRVAQAAVADDDEPEIGTRGPQEGDGVHQQIEAFLRLETADRADDRRVRGNPERRAGAGFARRLTPEQAMVDAIQNGRDPLGPGSMPDELVPDIARHGDQARISREHLLVERVVHEPLPPAVTGPSVCGGQRQHPRRPPEHQAEEVRLVVVRMNDVGTAVGDDPAERPPDRRIEGMPFLDLLIVDRGAGCPRRHAERLVAAVPDIADRHGESRRIGPGRALQNRFLGAAAGATDASKLKDANWP